MKSSNKKSVAKEKEKENSINLNESLENENKEEEDENSSLEGEEQEKNDNKLTTNLFIHLTLITKLIKKTDGVYPVYVKIQEKKMY